jgi:CheY-like chemotaxis protein
MLKYSEIVILIAEDDDGHADLIQDQLIESGINNQVIRFTNGAEAWDFLTNLSMDDNKAGGKAYLLLLDINMPKMSGIEVLKNIKSDSKLKTIPVVMLTTTDDPREIEECYKLGCNVYITKPVDFNKFTDRLKKLGLLLKIVSIAEI